MNVNGNEPDRPAQQEQTPAEMAGTTLQNVSSLIERSAVIQGTLPGPPTLELVQAVKAGIAARMLADLTNMTVGATHPLMGAVTEYISISMGLLCHFTGQNPDTISHAANAALEKVQEMQTQHAPSDDMGTPTVIQGEPPTPQ